MELRFIKTIAGDTNIYIMLYVNSWKKKIIDNSCWFDTRHFYRLSDEWDYFGKIVI